MGDILTPENDSGERIRPTAILRTCRGALARAFAHAIRENLLAVMKDGVLFEHRPTPDAARLPRAA